MRLLREPHYCRQRTVKELEVEYINYVDIHDTCMKIPSWVIRRLGHGSN